MENWQRQLIETAVTLVIIFVCRFFAGKYIDKSTLKSDQLKRRWQVQIRNLTFIIFVFSLFMIWGTELRSLALSLMAIVAAIVLATKELILCLTGSFLKASSNSFAIGDRIQINTVRGIVTDQTLLTTTLIEVGPSTDSHQVTGKSVVVPNSQFLSQAVINENSNEYTLHSFSIKLKIDDNLLNFKEELLNVLKSECKYELPKATRFLNKSLEGKKIDDNTCQPRVVLQIIDDSNVKLIFRAFMKVENIGRIEQKTFEKYVTLKAASMKKDAAEKETEK